MPAKREKPDHFTLQARKEGYPARSVYKLKEIQEKFRVIRRSSTVLDIGAAPGSWSLYVHRETGAATVAAIDLAPADPSLKKKPIHFIRGDAFAPETRPSIDSFGPYDVILSDAAPATTGNRLVDTARSLDIAEQVLRLSSELLKPGGNLVVKVFQGSGQEALIETMKNSFTAVRGYKPKASRSESFETYFVCTGKKE